MKDKSYFEEGVQKGISFIDEVLSELGQPNLLENPEFEIDNNKPFDGLSKHHLCLKGVHNKKRVSIDICVSNFDITFNIENTYEWPCIPYEDEYFDNIEARNFFKQELKSLFSQPVYLEMKGKKTVIRLFDSSGTQVSSLTFRTSVIFSDWFQKRKVWLKKPFFEKCNTP